MRISQANEECQRAPNHQSPSSKWAQATLCLRGKFPKQVRLRTRFEFRKIQREGRKFQGSFLNFQFVRENFIYPRLGMTVSKQFGSAALRNLLKRRIREVFRLAKHLFPAGLSLHVAPRPKTTMPTFEQVQADFTFLLEHLQKC